MWTSSMGRDEKGDVVGGKRKYEIMAAMSLAGRDEMGASALRRCFNALMDNSNNLISASMDFRWCSRELRGSIVESI
jgi:hypothetical protein